MITIQEIAAHCLQRVKAANMSSGLRRDQANQFEQFVPDFGQFRPTDVEAMIKSAQFFDVEAGICSAAWEFRVDFAVDGNWHFPESCRLPAQITALRFQFPEYSDRLFVAFENDVGFNPPAVMVIMISPFGNPAVLGYFVPGSGELKIAERFKHHKGAAIDAVGLFAMVLSLINEPRMVLTKKGGDRSRRRFNHRGFGLALDCWHSCAWNIGESVKAKLSADPTFHKMPLHFRRGHFKAAESTWKNAVRLPASLVNGRPEGWYQMIAGQWVGHPAFGIKRHLYSPQLDAETLARKGGGNADQG